MDNNDNASVMLCDQCRTYDFWEWFFPASREDWAIVGRSAPLGQEHFSKSAFATGLLDDCIFCKFLSNCIDIYPEMKVAMHSGDLSSFHLSVDKYGTIECSSELFNEGESVAIPVRGWHQTDNTFTRVVRFLRIAYNPIGRRDFHEIKIYPTVQDSHDPKDNVMLNRILPRDQIDLALPTKWLELCDADHQPVCDPVIWQDIGKCGVRMIDVEQRCVVMIDEWVEYLALSYTWGNPNAQSQSLTLTMSNIQELSTPFALSECRSDLPTTIRDAILLTKQLGKRYVWIDALCICQDDIESKLVQIGQMDRIYGHASLTLVAAGGDSSWSGLTGLRAGSRPIEEASAYIDGILLSAQYPRKDSDYAISRSTWATRAWTLQEHSLSSRLLFFTQNEISWECKSAVWTESLHLEHVDRRINIKARQLASFATKPSQDLTALQHFNTIMSAVSRRKLTHQDDRLRCIQGMLNVLSKDFPGGFHWGHPVATFDSSLLFDAGTQDWGPHARNAMFPSWCWAGWQSDAYSSIASPYDIGFSRARDDAFFLEYFDHAQRRDTSWLRKEAAWYRVSEDKSSWKAISSTMISDEGSYFYSASLQRWRESEEDQILAQPKAQLQSSQNSSMLEFAIVGWTQAVWLSVDRNQSTRTEARGLGSSTSLENMYTVRSPSGVNICYLAITKEHRDLQPNKLKFILISHHRRWERYGAGPYFDLLYVSTNAGITSRIQGVRDCTINIETWKALIPAWELVVLC